MIRAGRLPLMCLCLGWCLLASSAAFAQSTPQAPEVPWEGFQAFKFLLLVNGLEPVASFDDLVRDRDAQRSVLISLGGDCSELRAGPGGLRTFLRNGGTALIATDRASDPVLQQEFGLRITGDLCRARNPAEGYLGKADCPFLMFAARPDGPRVQNLRHVATNVPSYLDALPPPDIVIVHRDWSFLRRAETRRGESIAPFRFGEIVFEGARPRAVVLADQSIFINGMMLPSAGTGLRAPNPGNDNLAFATALIDWLRQGPHGQRTRVLFMENGQVVTDFGNLNDWLQSLNKLPVPPLRGLPTPPVAVLNSLITGLEREDIFNQILFANTPFSRVLAVIAGWSAALLVLYGLYRAFQTRHVVEANSPPFAAAIAEAAPAGTPTEQRRQAMLREGALWELSRDAVRQAFMRLGVSDGREATPLPRVEISGGWRQRSARLRTLQRLWRLAHRETPRRISPAEFAAIVGQIRDIEVAVADGTLQLARAPEEA